MLFLLRVDIINVKMNISKYFDKSYEKIDLSGNSNPKEKSKKIKVTATGLEPTTN